MSRRDPLLTDMRHASGWYAILPEPKPANRLKGEHVADWVVVGAGVTGLAAARRLGELAPDARIILLDSYRVGYGASGRNAGIVIDTPHLTEEFDHEDNRRVSRLVIAGTKELESHVHTHNIDCEWSKIGHLTAVVQSKKAARLKATIRTLDAIDEDYHWLDKDALARVVGTDHYHGAVLTPRSIMVSPAAMCRGLGETLPENVELFEESPVQKVDPGSPVHVQCAEGTIRAKNVLLTTNAFVTKLGFLKGKVFPLIGCGSLSRPLTEDEQAAMGGESEWGITGATTVRRTLSNRILVRYGTYYTADFRLNSSRRHELLRVHRMSLKRRFPMLGKLEFEHTWAGVYCMTWGWDSQFGQVEPGVFAALGYCGVGLPRGTISGSLLAEYAMGGQSDLIADVQKLSDPRRLPPQPFLGIGIQARLAWYRWQSRGEV
jgi:glycine/D-amino acid oxidase-like deaminating enzyme